MNRCSCILSLRRSKFTPHTNSLPRLEPRRPNCVDGSQLCPVTDIKSVRASVVRGGEMQCAHRSKQPQASQIDYGGGESLLVCALRTSSPGKAGVWASGASTALNFDFKTKLRVGAGPWRRPNSKAPYAPISVMSMTMSGNRRKAESSNVKRNCDKAPNTAF